VVLSKEQAFLLGLSIGIKKPSGGGERQIILHNGSNDGLLAGLLLFK
jgi:hypothetical protein